MYEKSIGFSFEIEVFSKNKKKGETFWKCDGFSAQIKVFSKKTKKGHLDTDCSVAFQTQTEQRGKGVWVGMLNILRGKNILYCPKNIKLPKILTQNCSKSMKSRPITQILMQNRPKNIEIAQKLPEISTP